MPFVRRFRSVPTETVIQEIEGPVIVDLPPPGVVTGAGSGTVLVVGEFEDGPFALDPDTPENSAILQPSGTAGFSPCSPLASPNGPTGTGITDQTNRNT